MRYEDIYANLLGTGSFSAGEFRAGAISPSPDKVLHDMVSRGYLKKTARGLYETLLPEEVFSAKARSYESELDWLLEIPKLDFALCSSDAVSIWTNGGYNTGGTRFITPINIAVGASDTARWARLLRSAGKQFCVSGRAKRETMVGTVFVLHPSKSLTMVRRNGMPVIPLEETIEMCRANPFVYEPALEMFDKLYGAKTGMKYDTYYKA